MRLRSQQLSAQLAAETTRLRTALAQQSDLAALAEQLRAQEARLTRALVAGEALIDFEFVICPRCGHSVLASRGDDSTCLLCLQPPPPSPNPAALQQERDRIAEQIADTLDLLERRAAEVQRVRETLAEVERARSDVGTQLDTLTATYVSDRQVEITQVAADRSRVETEIAKYDQYLAILQRAEDVEARTQQLAERATQLRRELEEASTRLRIGQGNVSALEDRFEEYLRRLNVPTFGQPLTAKLDPTTYLPIVSGRSFERLSSQGLKVLVNVAHALAHHTVAIDRDLPLPGLLVIDGASSNVGTEDYDQQRLEDMYHLFADISATYGDRLQILVVDNSVPAPGQEWIRLTLTQEDRLLRLSSAVQTSGTTAA